MLLACYIFNGQLVIYNLGKSSTLYEQSTKQDKTESGKKTPNN